MSHNPQPGEVGHLPGTGYLTCPMCGTTNVVFDPVYPFDLVGCLGCRRSWRIYDQHTSFLWVPLKVVYTDKEKPDAADA